LNPRINKEWVIETNGKVLILDHEKGIVYVSLKSNPNFKFELIDSKELFWNLF